MPPLRRRSRPAADLRTRSAKREVFPRLAVQMVQVGEESGELDGMLLKTADTFDRETTQAMDRFLAAPVPALTIVDEPSWSARSSWRS